MRVGRHLFSAVLILFIIHHSPAQEVNGRFGTSVYTWERFDTVGSSRTIARAFQSMQLDISHGDVQFQTSLLGALTLHDDFGDDGSIRTSKLMLRWKNIGQLLDVSVGRVPVFAGVGIGTVDGGLIRANLMDRRVTLQAYGGGNVRSDLVMSGLSNLEKNFLIGAQATGDVARNVRVGLSYVNRNVERDGYVATRPDSIGNPILVSVAPDSKAQQLIGADGRYEYLDLLTLYGRFDYDLNLAKSHRTQLHTRVRLNEKVNVTGEYIFREPQIYYNSYFTVFEGSPSREYEGGVEYMPRPDMRTFLKYAYVQFTDAVSRRLSAGAAWEYLSIGVSGANGYAGELTSIDITAMYPLQDRMFIPTLGFAYSSYQLDESNSARNGIYAGSLGLVARPMEQFSVDAQVQWLRNPVAEHDVRLCVKLNYWFHTNLTFLGDESR